MSAPTQWHALRSPAAIADALIDLYGRRGWRNYDEILSQTDHASQCGALAIEAGAPPELVVAAFLHDVGHLLMDEESQPPEDRHHEDVGARFLASWFGPGVTEPVRLHVRAKRYLCAVDPVHAAGLSAGSTRSLALQGGPMSPAEVAAFDAVPCSAAAVDLRRWDDSGKVVGSSTPDLTTFGELIVGVLGS